MNGAADMEDKTEKAPVTPGEVLPARQLLADMLMKTGAYAEALSAYEAELAKHPLRFNSLYGAAQASEKAGHTTKAKKYYEQLMEVAGKSGREEVLLARSIVKNN
jgi:tetratricopeptide (TPR) repeat protein